MVVDPRGGKRRRVVESQESTELTRDARFEVLLRFTVEDLQRFCRIGGARASSIVRSAHFGERYVSQQRERGADKLLVVSETDGQGWKLVSTTVHDPESTCVLRSSPTLTRQFEYCDGLLCSGSGQVVTLFNPRDGASRTLPPFPVDQAEVKTFIGFDLSIGRFKILGVSKKAASEVWGDQHIYTLEDPSWRPLDCSITHDLFPKCYHSKSISIGGQLFYTALLPDKRCTLIHLDLASECFGSNVVPELPFLGLYFLSCGLLDVKGKPGVCFLQGRGTYKLWILQSLSDNIWSPMLIQTPCCIQDNLSHFSSLSFEGLTRCGELVFSEVDGRSLFLHCYNLATRVSKKELIHESSASTLRRTSFWNHKTSLMFSSAKEDKETSDTTVAENRRRC